MKQVQSQSQSKYIKYEQQKQALYNQKLTDKEYQSKLKEIVRELKI